MGALFEDVRSTARGGVIRQFHHVVKGPGGFIFSHLEDIQESGVGAGNRLELLDTQKLPIEWAAVLEGVSIDLLHSVLRCQHAAGQPDLTVAPFSNSAEQCVIGNFRDRWIVSASVSVSQGNGAGSFRTNWLLGIHL